MWFLIRTAFWFSMVLVMLPIFDNEASDRLKNEKGVEITDALGAAAGALSYVGSMCSEKPDVCVRVPRPSRPSAAGPAKAPASPIPISTRNFPTKTRLRSPMRC